MTGEVTGEFSGRQFRPGADGGEVRELDWRRVRITDAAIEAPRRACRVDAADATGATAERIIAALSQVSDPRDRLERLITQVNLSEGAARFHASLTASADHPVVRPVLARVTARRLEYLVEGPSASRVRSTCHRHAAGHLSRR